MNLLSLILIVMALIVGACVFYVAWQLSSGEFESNLQEKALDAQRESGSATRNKEEPGESKESEDSPGP